MASEIHPPSGRAFTKIVATVGPACSDQPTLEEMIRAGAEQDMAMIEQMNRNNERRLNTILQLIKDI